MSVAPVIVLDGEQRSALAVVRSLGTHGWPTHVGSYEDASLAGGSRYATSETRLPHPTRFPKLFSEEVKKLVVATGARVVFPLTDQSVVALLEHPGSVAPATVPFGDLAAFLRASNKELVLALGSELGIAVPRQWVIDGPDAIPAPIPADVFPLVLKPCRSLAGSGADRSKVIVSYARDPSELAARLRAIAPVAFPVLIQRRISGPGLGVFLLRWNGITKAIFAHRRLKEFPPSGGVSVCCESVSLSEQLAMTSEALLNRLGWSGVAMVEFKLDSRTGEAFLMEVNARFWGSLQLAIDAGVDFPWYLARLALGEEVPSIRSWRVGLKSRWEWGEVNYLLARLRKKESESFPAEESPGLFETVAGASLLWRPGYRNSVLRVRDPVPFLRESRRWGCTVLGLT